MSHDVRSEAQLLSRKFHTTIHDYSIYRADRDFEFRVVWECGLASFNCTCFYLIF